MRKLIFTTATAVGSISIAVPALAQETDSPAASDATEVAAGDIVVTAQRRSESLQKVPVSLTAVTAEALETRHINDLTEVSRAAPSLQVGSDNTFAVRGVGTLAFAGTIDSSVALALDEVNLGRPFLGGALFNDLERVEVLNGPQGLLFGKNASAGLLNIVTRRPKIGVWEGFVETEYVSRDTPASDKSAWGVVARGAVNIPVSTNAALRLNASYSNQQAGMTYVGTPRPGVRNDHDLESYSIKAKLLFEPTDALSVYLIADYSENHGIAGLYARSYYVVSPGSTNLAALAADGITPGENNFEFGGEGGYWRDLKTGGAQAKIAYELPSGIEISNLFAWRFYHINQQFDIDNLSRDGASRNYTDGRYDQYTNELRVALPSGNRLSGQVGFYYFKSTLDQLNQIDGGNYVPGFVARNFPFCVGATAVPGAFPPTCSVSNVAFLGRDNDYVLGTQSYAGFGQLTFDLTDRLKLIAGGRLTHDDISIHLVQGQRRYFQNLGGPTATIEREYSNTDFSWKLGAQFQATPDLMVYGFYGRGYKGPGFNDIAPVTTASLVVRAEKSNTAEIGIKSSFFDRRLTVNLAAFHTKFDDFQVQSFDTIIRTFQVQNAAKVTTKGVEATIYAAPVEGLTINASASLLSSKFDSFLGAQCYPTQATMGCSATVNTFDAAGLDLPNSPHFTSSVQAMYEFPTAGDVKPFIEGNWYHRSSTKANIPDTPGALIPTADIFGASIGVNIRDRIRLSAFCKNCTNVHSPTTVGTDPGDASARNSSGQPIPMLTLTRTYGLEAFRTIGASVSLKF